MDESDRGLAGTGRLRLDRRRFLAAAGALAGLSGCTSPGAERSPGPTRQVERLDRGVVAVPSGEGVLVRWRLLATDPDGVGFTLYRDGTRVNDAPVTGSTNYHDPDGSAGATYTVRPVVDGEERSASAPAEVWADGYLRIPMNRPPEAPHASPFLDSTVPYHANDASVGDLTGDGSYDIVVKWSPENAKDNAHEGYTNQHFVDGYTMGGEHRWRIELGTNLRAGAHYLPYLVYDFDGDGTAEVVMRTADGTTDAAGTVVGDPDADWRNEEGRILEGPEYLTVFDGDTGEVLATRPFAPARGDVADWGDDYGNRADRFLAGVAYLDGARPSFVMARGYYAKTMLVAYDYRDGDLTKRWTFDSDDPDEDYGAYEGKGAHTLSTADLDGDGRDEIVYGGAAIDHDGSGLHTTTMKNPDAQHCGNFVPDRAGLEIFVPAESPPADAPSASMRDGETGEYIWSVQAGDVGRAMVADVDPAYRGAEAWGTGGVGTWTAEGEKLRDDPIPSVNAALWWTGDRGRELLDHDWRGGGVGIPKIDRWDPDTESLENLVTFSATRSNNWTKGNPCLSADVVGDWREELLLREPDSEHLRLYATPHETDYRLDTLMHDPMYRTGVARQNVGYNQPPWPSFFLGYGMGRPPRPDVVPAVSDGSPSE